MNNKTDRFDIVIVGAGLVGASLAAALGQSSAGRQLAIAVIDAGRAPGPRQPANQSNPERFDPRVVAITRQSQQLFERTGIWPAVADPPRDSMQHPACPYTHMHVWDGEGTGQIDFDAAELDQESLGFIVENNCLIKHLTDKIVTLDNIVLRWGEKVEQLELAGEQNHSGLQRVVLSSGQALEATLILAADGANSPVRQLAGIATREWQYGQRALVTTVKTERPHAFTAWQRFMATGPLAFLPLVTASGENHYSSIVWSLDNDQAAEIEALDDLAFRIRLTQAFEAKLGQVQWVDQRFSFPLQQRHAKRYIAPGLALVGDAAHVIHPLAGQGVNLGLLDVIALVDELDRASKRQIPLGDYSILRRYQRARMGPNLAMMGLMEGFKRLFGSRHGWLQLLRNTGMTGVGRVPLLRAELARRAMGL